MRRASSMYSPRGGDAAMLTKYGIQLTDPRLTLQGSKETDLLLRNAATGSFVIPNWEDFQRDIQAIYDEVKSIEEGENASYIPQLAQVDPNFFGVSVCTVDGQILEIGDTDVHFSVQSCSKPITYLIAVEENSAANPTGQIDGERYVHNFVGREPSGRNFNELCLDQDNIPHNPMINAGSIMCVSLIAPECSQADRYEKIFKYWSRMCGGEKINFNNSIYLSEKSTADRNFSLAYMMQEKGAFQRGKSNSAKPRSWSATDLRRNLELYFQCCSIEMTCTQIAKVGGTLANGGMCPFTKDAIFNSDSVKNVLSLMHSCGMYDYSGEWSYLVGIPAKSGVSGIIYGVIPNVMSIAVYSPRLDKIGNSVRGIEFFKRFIRRFNFHVFDSLMVSNDKKTITKQFAHQGDFNMFLMLEAASRNDVDLLRKLLAQRIEVNSADYDKRTALHVAASNGNLEVVRLLVGKGANVHAVDRWGNTPLNDAIREKHQEIIDILSAQNKV